MFAETNFSFAKSTGNVIVDARGVDLGDAVDDLQSAAGEELPGHLGNSSTDLHAVSDLLRYNNEVRRSVVSSEQPGPGCHKEVRWSNIAPEQSDKGCDKVFKRSDVASK